LVACGAIIVLGAIAAGVYFWVIIPSTRRGRIKDAEEITRKTFQEKLGRTPDTLTFEGTDRKDPDRKDGLEEGWALQGVARVGSETYDVRVTYLKKTLTKSAWLQCEATPRKQP
jgi:hypothetical protein